MRCCARCGYIGENFYTSNKYVCKDCLKKSQKKPPPEAKHKYYLNEHEKALERGAKYRDANKQEIAKKSRERRSSIKYKCRESIFNQARLLLSIRPKELTPLAIKYLAYRKIFRLLETNKINNLLAIKYSKKISKNPSLDILMKIYELKYR